MVRAIEGLAVVVNMCDRRIGRTNVPIAATP